MSKQRLRGREGPTCTRDVTLAPPSPTGAQLSGRTEPHITKAFEAANTHSRGRLNLLGLEGPPHSPSPRVRAWRHTGHSVLPPWCQYSLCLTVLPQQTSLSVTA